MRRVAVSDHTPPDGRDGGDAAAMVIWIIGLSAAGKTTVGSLLAQRLRQDRGNVVFLDGDQMRAVWGDDLGHGIDARRVNADRICRLYRALDRQGLHVVTSILSLFPESRAWNRAHLSRYFEVYLDVPMDELKRRDTKGLYGSCGTEGANVVGVDIPWEPDFRIAPPEVLDPPQTIVSRILAAIGTIDEAPAR